MKQIDLVGQRFGNREIIRNECVNDDWIKIGKPIPTDTSRYVLGKCLNCGAVLPTHKKNIYKQPPKRCVFCSNIGNHYTLETNTNSWVVQDEVAICNVIFHGQVVSFVIDADRYDDVSKHIWRISQKKNKYYVITGSVKKKSMQYLHQMIMGEKIDGMEIDHIDGNSLNNMRSNLRYVTHLQNVDNTKATRIDNTIGIRGISYDKRSKRYTVDFNYHGDRYYFKTWKMIEEAVYCRYFIEKQFGMDLVENNPMFKQYQLNDEQTKKEIEEYVLLQISRKGRQKSLYENQIMV